MIRRNSSFQHRHFYHFSCTLLRLSPRTITALARNSPSNMETRAGEIASTLQTASINRHPDPARDVNPSTAASANFPVSEVRPVALDEPPASPSAIPLRARAQPRRSGLPPLPDLRFEQSYLASIPAGASSARVLYITVKDQVLAPLVQGMAWTLILAGWRHWNRGAQMAGQGVGARIRRWWWQVNKWDVPREAQRANIDAERVGEVS